MVNNIKIFVLGLTVCAAIFVLYPGSVWADNSDDDLGYEEEKQSEVADNAEDVSIDEQYSDLEEEYGKDLKKAPYAIRYAFAHESNASWNDATYDQRGDFLRKWRDEKETREAAEEQERLQKEQEQYDREMRQTNEKMLAEQRIAEREQAKLQKQQEEEDKKLAVEMKNESEKMKLQQLRASQHTR